MLSQIDTLLQFTPSFPYATICIVINHKYVPHTQGAARKFLYFLLRPFSPSERGEPLKHRLQLIRSEKGEASYISSFIYILIAVILIAFILNVFHIVSVKQEMDHCADQLTKQIQLNGGVNDDTASLFSFLSSQMDGVEELTWQVDSPVSTDQIQIGTPFYVTVSGQCYLGGFWNFNLVPIRIVAQGAGVSEHYWK